MASAEQPSMQTSADVWSTYMQGARKRGYNREAAGIEEGVVARWMVDQASEVNPVVADGTVFVGAESLWALAAGDGSEQWSFDGDGPFLTATVVDDTVYAGTGAGVLYALAAGDGSEQWSFEIDNAITGLNVAEGTVFAIEQTPDMDGDRLHAVAAETGEKRWTFERGYGGELGTNPRIAPEPAVADGTAYVKADTVYALDVGSGETVWKAEDGYYTSFATLAVADSTVYASTGPSSDPDEFRALNAADGSVEWAFSPDFEGREWSSPVVGDDAVYVGQNDRDGGLKLYALDRADGSVRWERDDYAREAALAGGVLYLDLYRESGDLNGLDAEDGSVLWNYDAEMSVSTAPAIVGETIFVGASPDTDAPGVMALKPATTTPTGTGPEEPTATDTRTSTDAEGGGGGATETPTDTPVDDSLSPTNGTTEGITPTEGAAPGFGVVTAIAGTLAGIAYSLADLGRDGDE